MLIVANAIIGLNGCASFHTQIMEHRHWELNDTIRETQTEQLLLNMVRLRYDETPFFLQVSSITTSFSTSAGLGASGQAVAHELARSELLDGFKDGQDTRSAIESRAAGNGCCRDVRLCEADEKITKQVHQ